MSAINTAALRARIKRDLPPSAPLPAAVQTIACSLHPLRYFEWCRARYGDRFVVYPIDMPPLVFLANPSDIYAMATAPHDALHAGEGIAVLAPLVGPRAFMVSDGDVHLDRRSKVAPAFEQDAVWPHAEMIEDLVRHEISTWPHDAEIALHPRLRSLVLDIVLKVVFAGVEVPHGLHQSTLQMLAVSTTSLLQEPKLRRLPGWRRAWARFVHDRAVVDRHLAGIIQRQRENGGEPMCLLDRLLAARAPDGALMSDREIRDHIMAVVVAGYETTAAEVAWALQLLAHHGDVQMRLTEEVVRESPGRYLKAVVQETIRHRPVFPLTMPRAVKEPIEIGGRIYRPPAHLVGCTYLMHHDPTHYREPHVFRPERFLEDTRRPYTWLPWGAGARRCFGRHLAVLIAERVLSEALWSFRLFPAAQTMERPRWRSAILVPHAECRVILQRRDRRRSARPAHSVASHPTGRHGLTGCPAGHA